jgi:phage shock protein PspC (stress-responsive transcriptional regulator)
MKDQDRFCPRCGQGCAATAPPRLTRDMRNHKIAGVCAGLARHHGWDVTLVRVLFIAATVVHGLGLIAYLIAWVAMPRDDDAWYQARPATRS